MFECKCIEKAEAITVFIPEEVEWGPVLEFPLGKVKALTFQ